MSRPERAKYLLFSSVGRHSVHREYWLAQGDQRDFDICLYNYSDDPTLFQADADIYVARRGTKFDNLAHLMDSKPELVAQYDAVLAIDDDMRIDTLSLNKLFRIFSRCGLDLAQPGFTRKSVIPHPVTRQRLNNKLLLRYTNFIENNIALFSRTALQKLRPTFRQVQSGYGLDYVWPEVLGRPERKIAVIDAVGVFHPRRAEGRSELDQVLGRRQHSMEGERLAAQYGVALVRGRPKYQQYGCEGRGLMCWLSNIRSRLVKKAISPFDLYILSREKLYYILRKRNIALPSWM